MRGFNKPDGPRSEEEIEYDISKSKLDELSKEEETLNNSTTNISLSQELTNLSKLQEDGILSEEEYKIAKMKVLSSI